MTDKHCTYCGREGHRAHACPLRGWQNHKPADPQRDRHHVTREELAEQLDRAGISHNITHRA